MYVQSSAVLTVAWRHFGIEPPNHRSLLDGQPSLQKFDGANRFPNVVEEYQKFWGLPVIWGVVRNQKRKIQEAIGGWSDVESNIRDRCFEEGKCYDFDNTRPTSQHCLLMAMIWALRKSFGIFNQ